ncbi:hypothetical protein BDR06DRAFT_998791 [Suillus hirtellus]|nr:hypothetical protein BDR06DRAFT_998791 [Suillus hirtellus]
MSSFAFLVTELSNPLLASPGKNIQKYARQQRSRLRYLGPLQSKRQRLWRLTAHSQMIFSVQCSWGVFMGCATKNAKVVAISLGSLQCLIALKAVPQSVVPLIISTMNDATSQGVDIQLRILQTLVSSITNFPSIHEELLGEALLLCFKLQDSRIAVVSLTAAATLRHLVMFIFEKIVNEDHQENDDALELSEATLTEALGPCAKDAFSVFEDLCLLANSEKPNFLKLDYLLRPSPWS